MNLPDQRERHAARYRNGVSHDDLKVIGALLPWFQGQGDCVHVTVAPHGASDDQRYELFDDIRKRIPEYQRRSGMKRLLRVEVREVATEHGISLHIHIISVFSDFEWARKFVASINGSKALKRLGEKAVVAVRIVDADHWKRLGTYFTTEATMQAWYASYKSFPKPSGPFHFDGDRVVPSPDAKEWLVRNERMPDWKRTNARRHCIPASGSEIAPDVAAGTPIAISAPVIEALPATGAVALVTGDYQATPVQLSLFESSGAEVALFPAPASIIKQVEERRKQLCMTQAAMARIIGVRQSHYANALRGHDSLSPWSMKRAREFLTDTTRGHVAVECLRLAA